MKMEKYIPERAVHYCNFDTFLKIFEPFTNDEHLKRLDDNDGSEYEARFVRFFASDIHFLNDRVEYEIGKNYVKSLSKRLDETAIPEKLFIACFCNDTDNLTQWKYYGKEAGSGLAIEFDTDDVVLNYCDNCKCAKLKDPEEYPQMHDISFMPHKVHYGPKSDSSDPSDIRLIKKMNREIKAMLPKIHELSSITGNTAIRGVIPYIKHQAFKDEKESRITLYQIRNSGNYCSSIKYRAGNVIKPFIELRMLYGNKKAEKQIPIKSITIGPDRDQDLLFSSIYYLLEEDSELKAKNLDGMDSVITSGGIKIAKSTVPFRS